MADPPRQVAARPGRGSPPGDPDGGGGGAERSARFDRLYAEEWSGLVALGWSLTGSWPVAEELAQDAFADAFRRWDTVGRLDRPGAWVRRAVVNRATSHHRHRAVEHRVLATVDARAAREADGRAADRTGDGAAERIGDPAFWAAVRSLPERQAAAVALHYLEDRPVAEIADILDCRPATVKVHLHRGRLTLAKRLRALTDREPPTSAAGAPATDGAARPDERPDERPETDLREERR